MTSPGTFRPSGRRRLTPLTAAARVYTNVKYKKQPWGVVKSFITKNSWSGIEDNFRQLGGSVINDELITNEFP